METEFEKTILDALHKLPKQLGVRIASLDITAELSNVNGVEVLNESQLIALENEILFVFLGLDDIPSFTTNVRHSVQISRDRAESVTKQVVEKIFTTHSDILQEVFTIQGFQEHTPTRQKPQVNTQTAKEQSNVATPQIDQYREPTN